MLGWKSRGTVAHHVFGGRTIGANQCASEVHVPVTVCDSSDRSDMSD